MEIGYHILEFMVRERGSLVRFDYRLPSNVEVLTGITAIYAGPSERPRRRRKVGTLTLEALNRKIHLATLPVMNAREIGKREGLYLVMEPLSQGSYLNGAYVDHHLTSHRFVPYRVRLVLKTRGKEKHAQQG
jgi:hypothetical protein